MNHELESKTPKLEVDGQNGSRRLDLTVGLGLSSVASAACIFRSSLLEGRLNDAANFGVYFAADTSRVFANMCMNGQSHRSHIHPLFTAFTAPPVAVFRKAFGASPDVAVNMYMALICGAWTFVIWKIARGLDLPRGLAASLTLLGTTSASAMFWFPVAETHALASLSVAAALLLLVSEPSKRTSFLRHLFVSLGTFGVTITNWLVGLLTSVLILDRRSLIRLVILTIGISATVFAFEKLLMWDHEIPGRYGREVSFLERVNVDRLFQVARIFFVNVMVMAEPHVESSLGALGETLPFIHLQKSSLGHRGALEWAAILSWLGLLSLGFHGLATNFNKNRPLATTLALSLGFHLVLYTAYGDETFLFIINCLPLLLAVCSFAHHSPVGRRLSLPLALGALACSAANNWFYFASTAQMVSKL